MSSLNRFTPLAVLAGLAAPLAMAAPLAAQETAPAETAPAETAPAETAPAETAAAETAAAAGGPAEREPNDRLATATPVASEASVEGRIDRPGDVDWYLIDATDRGELAVWLDAVPAGIEPMLQLFSDDREAMTDWQRGAGPGIGPELIVDLPRAGKFAIALRDDGDDGTAGEPYRLSVALTPPAGGEEPNDRPSQATVLSLDGSVEAAIFPRRDPDWFAVEVPGAGELTVTLSAPPPDIDPVMVLWGADRSGLSDWLRPQVSGGDIAGTIDVARAGRIFVEVHDSGDDARALDPYAMAARFTPAAADPGEPNNGYAAATALTFEQGAAGTLFPRGDADWYAIEVPQAGELAIRVSAVPVAIDPIMRLWTPDVETASDWARAARPGADVELILDLDTPGRYVLELRDNGDDARGLEPYRLAAALVPAAADGGEPNGRLGAAAALAVDGTPAPATIFPQRDHDWYVASVPGGGTLAVSIPAAPGALDMMLQVIDGDRQWLMNPVRAARAGATVQAEVDVPAAGDYFIEVFDGSDDARALEPYQVAARYAAAEDGGEPDSATAPRTLAAGQPASGAIFPRGDHDWFALQAAAAGVLEVTLPSPPRGVDLVFRVWSAPEAPLSGWIVPAKRGSMLRGAVELPQPGTYLIELSDGNDDQRAAAAYRLQATVR